MTFIDSSLCSSDCENKLCQKHMSRQILGSPEMMSKQPWFNFSKECKDYKKIPNKNLKCPRCDSWEGLKFPRGLGPYCEECGWPEDSRND